MVLVIQIFLTTLLSTTVKSRHIKSSGLDTENIRWNEPNVGDSGGFFNVLNDMVTTTPLLDYWDSEEEPVHHKTAGSVFTTTTTTPEDTPTSSTQHFLSKLTTNSLKKPKKNSSKLYSKVVTTKTPVQKPLYVMPLIENVEKDSKIAKIQELKANISQAIESLNEEGNVTELENHTLEDDKRYIKILHSIIKAPLVLSIDWLLNNPKKKIKAKINGVHLGNLNEKESDIDSTIVDTGAGDFSGFDSFDTSFDLPKKVNTISMSGANQPSQVFVNTNPNVQHDGNYFFVAKIPQHDVNRPKVYKMVEVDGDNTNWYSMNNRPTLNKPMFSSSMFGQDDSYIPASGYNVVNTLIKKGRQKKLVPLDHYAPNDDKELLAGVYNVKIDE